jgi:hypothetical protein
VPGVLTIDIKEVSIEIGKIKAAVNSANREALVKWGLDVRKEIRKGIKIVAPNKKVRSQNPYREGLTPRQRDAIIQANRARQRRSSQPGKPPFSHTNDKTATIRNIVSVPDFNRGTVRVYPVKISNKSPLDNDVPEKLQFGGSFQIRLVQTPGRRWRPWRGSGKPVGVYRTVTAQTKARPYMNTPKVVKAIKDGRKTYQKAIKKRF